MVVDDDAAMRLLSERALETFGYRVLLAQNGVEATDLFRKRSREIAAVITDMAMPGMDGPSTIRSLRAINPAIRIIGSSGLTARSDLPRTGSGAPNNFLPKPYTTGALLTLLRQTLDRP
jgi:CheY-like chemotaxis protein